MIWATFAYVNQGRLVEFRVATCSFIIGNDAIIWTKFACRDH